MRALCDRKAQNFSKCGVNNLDNACLCTLMVECAARNGNGRQEAAAFRDIAVVEFATDGPTARLDLMEENPCDR